MLKTTQLYTKNSTTVLPSENLKVPSVFPLMLLYLQFPVYIAYIPKVNTMYITFFHHLNHATFHLNYVCYLISHDILSCNSC